MAQASGIRTRSTAFLLLDALVDGAMSKEEFRGDLARLLKLQYPLSASIYEHVLALSERAGAPSPFPSDPWGDARLPQHFP